MAEWRYQIKDLKLKAAGYASGVTTAPQDRLGAVASFFSTRLGFVIFLISITALDIAVWGLSGFSKSSAQGIVYARITPGAAVFYFYSRWLAHRKIRLAKVRDEHERS